MDYKKIDAYLASALADIQDKQDASLAIFIHTDHPPTSDEANSLKSLGINRVGANQQIFTATVSPHAIQQLSEKPWVHSIKLANRLRSVHVSSNYAFYGLSL